jgi:hypothetical protein
MPTWVDKIRDSLEDIATLDVVTTTGNITLTTADTGALTNWEKLADKVSEKIKAAEIEVVAYTHSQWDCDNFTHVKKDLSDAEKLLVETHNATVDSAHELRREAVKVLKDLFS